MNETLEMIQRLGNGVFGLAIFMTAMNLIITLIKGWEESFYLYGFPIALVVVGIIIKLYLRQKK